MSQPPHPALTPGRLEQALGSIDPTSARVFRLHAVEGHDYGAISRITGLSMQEVERHLAKALAALARALEDPSS
ncbi:sigma factor-like helix-turn-helix DNA-binding protein [Sphingobium phenoxybenzoativorans]|uniref:sigma factor-like helix-turn-helix DNA-binding protein n=1 Tax=Sphingobium phenoxybenzoativorans TaxID=1592790 RepID=UPI0008727944|nr:sigma factor-like helix-turn-helix DNA-binding protein [Sphingobium phenoxybenzoativorans]